MLKKDRRNYFGLINWEVYIMAEKNGTKITILGAGNVGASIAPAPISFVLI